MDSGSRGEISIPLTFKFGGPYSEIRPATDKHNHQNLLIYWFSIQKVVHLHALKLHQRFNLSALKVLHKIFIVFLLLLYLTNNNNTLSWAREIKAFSQKISLNFVR